MSNKNKKKGFLKEMDGVQAKKVVFVYDEEEVRERTETPTTTNTSTVLMDALPFSNSDVVPPATRTRRLHFTPPSEIPKDRLAPNLMITSVVFPWNVRGSRDGNQGVDSAPVTGDGENRKTRRLKKREANQRDGVEVEEMGNANTLMNETRALSEEEHLVSDSTPVVSLSPRKPSAAEFGANLEDWEGVEKEWDALKRVKAVDLRDGSVKVGSVVAWKVCVEGLDLEYHAN